MKQILEHKTKEIVDIISNHDFNNLSILSGNTGSLFLLSYYAEYTKEDKYLEKVEEIIVEMYNKIQNGEYYLNFSYSNGLTGFLWAINNLNESGHIDIDINEYFEDTIPLIYEFIFEKSSEGDFDFLHGALGPVCFLLDTIHLFPNNVTVIKEFNRILLEKGITDSKQETLYFTSKIKKSDGKNEDVINLSLSHGMAAIINYLTRCIATPEIKSEELEIALKQIIKFYRLHQNPIKDKMSYFPSWVELKEHQVSTSRMAWCYGDLGIGLAFYKAGEALADFELKDFATELLKHSINRKELNEENIVEGNFCHGSSGLVETYRGIYQTTNEKIFLEASQYWLKVTLDLAVHQDGYAGYKAYNGKDKVYQNDGTLLEGATGIALVFLETLLEKPLPWKKALMLYN
jgi:lantibiotic biosynthesis protein